VPVNSAARAALLTAWSILYEGFRGLTEPTVLNGGWRKFVLKQLGVTSGISHLPGWNKNLLMLARNF
jgi:hypothetical protein